jgi:hypothetical protein
MKQHEAITRAIKQSEAAGASYAVKTMNGAWEFASTKPETFRVCFTFEGGKPVKTEVDPSEIGSRA